jgi:hypothetical protein
LRKLPACVATHGFDFLRDVEPIELGIVDQLAGRPAAQQRNLLLGPTREVLVVQVAHGYGSKDALILAAVTAGNNTTRPCHPPISLPISASYAAI